MYVYQFTIWDSIKPLLALLALALYSAFVLGCSGVSRVYIADYATGGKALIQTTVSDPHAFAPTTQRSWLELCEKATPKPRVMRAGNEAIELRDYDYVNCQRQGDVQFTTASGYITGLAGPLLYSGAAVGAAALIGDGLAESGDRSSNSTTTNQTTNTTIKGGLPPRR